MTMQEIRLGLIGAGNMGSALISGILNNKLLAPEQVCIYDIATNLAQKLATDLQATHAQSLQRVLTQSNTIIIAVKPQTMEELLTSIKAQVTDSHLLISIAAGIPIHWMQNILDGHNRIIRVMPNTPALVGCGAAGLARAENVNDTDMQNTLALFRAVGIAFEVPETQINAVTALSGSGPAYIFKMIEAMTSAGEQLGLDKKIAAALSLQTILGAARLADGTKQDPAELRRKVTSPNGTTEAGLKTMDQLDFTALIEKTIQSASDRAEELGKIFD